MIVLKHLAREFNIDPHKLRIILRNKYGKKGRWQWEDNDPELKKVRNLLRPGSLTNASQKS